MYLALLTFPRYTRIRLICINNYSNRLTDEILSKVLVKVLTVVTTTLIKQILAVQLEQEYFSS